MAGMHYFGAAIILLLIAAAGVYSGKKVETSADFSGGGRQAGTGLVAGGIIGSLFGGASTIGTAQLAFSYGFSAWWFTLGGGIGCILLAGIFAGPLHSSGITTISGIVSREYGQIAGVVSALLMQSAISSPLPPRYCPPWRWCGR